MRIYRSIATLFCVLSLSVFLVINPKNVSADVEEGLRAQLFSRPTAASTLRLPQELQETPEGRAAWKNLEQILKILPLAYFRKLTGEEVVQKIIQGLLEKLDPHTSYLPPEDRDEMRTQMRGTFGGLGMEIQKNTEGVPGIRVVSPIDDTPAERAGIRADDIITHIDGTPTAELTLSEAVRLMRGLVETNIQLTIFREGEEDRLTFDLVREIIKIRFVKYDLKEGYGMIRIAGFTGPVPQQILESLDKLVEQNGSKPLKGLVVNLRNNPGGLIDIADKVNDLFLDNNRYLSDEGLSIPQARVTVSEERRGTIRPLMYVGPSSDILNGIPLVILVNRGSASASELVALTLQLYGRAIIAGTQTFGKGTVQAVVPLQNNGAVRVTISQYLIGPAGCERPVQGVGVIPDIQLVYENESERLESELPNSIATSSISDADCQYHYELPRGHREAAYDMLRVFGLELNGNHPAER